MKYATFSKLANVSTTTIKNWVDKGHLLTKSTNGDPKAGSLNFDDEEEAVSWIESNTRYYQVLLPQGESLKAVDPKEIDPKNGFSYV